MAELRGHPTIPALVLVLVLERGAMGVSHAADELARGGLRFRRGSVLAAFSMLRRRGLLEVAVEGARASLYRLTGAGRGEALEVRRELERAAALVHPRAVVEERRALSILPGDS